MEHALDHASAGGGHIADFPVNLAVWLLARLRGYRDVWARHCSHLRSAPTARAVYKALVLTAKGIGALRGSTANQCREQHAQIGRQVGHHLGFGPLLRYLGILTTGSEGVVTVGQTQYVVNAFEECQEKIVSFIALCTKMYDHTGPVNTLQAWCRDSEHCAKALAPLQVNGFLNGGYHAMWLERALRTYRMAVARQCLDIKQNTLQKLSLISVDQKSLIAILSPAGPAQTCRAAFAALDYDDFPELFSMWACVLLCREVML